MKESRRRRSRRSSSTRILVRRSIRAAVDSPSVWRENRRRRWSNRRRQFSGEWSPVEIRDLSSPATASQEAVPWRLTAAASKSSSNVPQGCTLLSCSLMSSSSFFLCFFFQINFSKRNQRNKIRVFELFFFFMMCICMCMGVCISLFSLHKYMIWLGFDNGCLFFFFFLFVLLFCYVSLSLPYSIIENRLRRLLIFIFFVCALCVYL